MSTTVTFASPQQSGDSRMKSFAVVLSPQKSCEQADLSAGLTSSRYVVTIQGQLWVSHRNNIVQPLLVPRDALVYDSSRAESSRAFCVLSTTNGQRRPGDSSKETVFTRSRLFHFVRRQMFVLSSRT